MEITKIQSQTFQAKSKRYFLPRTARENLTNILTNMNNETVYQANRLTFSSDMLLGLKVGKDFFLHDKRGFIVPLNSKKYSSKQGDCIVKIGKKLN